MKLQNIYFNYKDTEVLHDVSFDLGKNQILGLVGHNGAGKSTVMKLMAGLLKPTKGKIETDASRVGILIETAGLYSRWTGYQNLVFFSELYKVPMTNLSEIDQILQVSSFWNKPVYKCSLGMKQRLGVAIALIGFPKLILLDEPTNGMDPEGTKELLLGIKQVTKNYDTSFLISSHILENIEEICDQTMIMKEGIIQDIYQKTNKIVAAKSITVPEKNVLEASFILEKNQIDFKREGNKLIVEDSSKVVKVLTQAGVDIDLIENLSLKDVYFNYE